MRTGKELILATKPYAKDSTAKSWYYILSTGFLLILALAGCIFVEGIFGRTICSVLAGLLTLRFFVIYHDQQHHAILPHSKAAEALMQVFGIYALSASSVWRSSHNHHHNHNSRLRGSHIGSFPIMTSTHFQRQPKGKKAAYLFSRSPIVILMGYLFVFIIGMCITPFRNNPRRHWDCMVSLLVHIGIGVALFNYGGWQAVFFAQFLPMTITFAIGSYLFYAQHNFPAVSFSDNNGWTYEKAALESSSYMKTGPVAAWFMANIGYHHVHHLNSKVPFYRLPEAMEGIAELREARVTTLNPVEIVRCFKLKVWDVEAGKMTGLPARSKKSAFQREEEAACGKLGRNA